MVDESNFSKFSAKKAWKNRPNCTFQTQNRVKNVFQAHKISIFKKYCSFRCFLHTLGFSDSKNRQNWSGGHFGAAFYKMTVFATTGSKIFFWSRNWVLKLFEPEKYCPPDVKNLGTNFLSVPKSTFLIRDQKTSYST